MEEWRVFGTGHYEVSNLGNVRRKEPGVNTQVGRSKKSSKSSNGYMIVGCFADGKRTNVLVHRAVAEAFIGACPDTQQVNHIDGDKTNNRLENLEYVTVSENMTHAIRIGLHVAPTARATGDKHWTRKNPENLKFGDKNPSRTQPEKVFRGEQCSSSKLNEHQVVEIRNMAMAGISMQVIADKFSVSRRNISEIVRRKSWKHVP
jgi:hypothetical protein